MAYIGFHILRVCLALILTGHLTDVSALQCHMKAAYSCEGGPCNDLLLPSGSLMGVSECAQDENMCGSINVGTAVATDWPGDFNITLSGAGCLNSSASSGCIDTDDLEEIYPTLMKWINKINTSFRVTLLLEACICDENLCNSTVKCNLSISLIIISFLFSFTF